VDTNYREKFLKELRENNSDILMIAYHCFSSMSYEDLEDNLNFLKGDMENNPNWFYDFHKSMRQTDFSGTLRVTYENNLLTDKEKNEYSDLKKIFGIKSEMFTISEDTAIENNLLEEYKRYRDLRKKSLNKSERSISGHMDMILWNLIHLDLKNSIKKFIEEFFQEI
jgi:hypothetical protein